MSKNNARKIKYCVFCGSNVEENKIYCPNCGKLIIKLEPGKKISKPKPIQKVEISRKCPKCGSLITSTILNQCPICNTELEKISGVKKTIVQKKPGLIFMDKKLEPEQKFVLKKDTWNVKEGLNVFGTCIYILVIIFLALYILLSFLSNSFTYDMTIQIILLSQIPELVFGLYPLWYIYKRKHSYHKLGFFTESKKIVLAIFIGILGTFVLLLINFISDSLINFISDAGLDFFNIKSSIEDQNIIIRNANILWIILLTISLGFVSISSEIVFRGVLHNTLKQRFNNIVYVILIVALAYSLLMLLFSFSLGVSFFFLNFLSFIILGFLYEINGNIYNTIIANFIYNILVMMLIYF
jgi:membrane protease YdiL (CAAX protease family)